MYIESAHGDVDFASRLQSLGIVSPNPFFPPSQQPSQAGSKPPLPNNSPLLSVLRNRETQNQAHELELEQQSLGEGSESRFLSAERIQQVLRMRSRGVEASVIEKQLRLKPGVVQTLGRLGIVDVVHEEP
jgi:hypothetical protein